MCVFYSQLDALPDLFIKPAVIAFDSHFDDKTARAVAFLREDVAFPQQAVVLAPAPLVTTPFSFGGAFGSNEAGGLRSAARESLGIPDDAVVFLALASGTDADSSSAKAFRLASSKFPSPSSSLPSVAASNYLRSSRNDQLSLLLIAVGPEISTDMLNDFQKVRRSRACAALLVIFRIFIFKTMHLRRTLVNISSSKSSPLSRHRASSPIPTAGHVTKARCMSFIYHSCIVHIHNAIEQAPRSSPAPYRSDAGFTNKLIIVTMMHARAP